MELESLNFAELRDAEIVARMRKCNYEKFKTLVRMHLSFELDLNTDEFDLPCHEIVYEDKGKLKKWNRLSKKHKHGGVITAALATGSAGCASVGIGQKSANNITGQNSGGSPTEGLNQQIDPGFLFHLQEIKEFLMLEKNLQQEGIFRKTGSASRQNELRSQIQNDKPLDLEASGYSAHDCATVFKGYLAELAEPLLTDAHYPAHLQIAPLCLGINSHIDDKDKQTSAQSAERVKKELHVLNSIQLLLLLLPVENRQLLQDIIDMLHAVARQHNINKMGPDNLATLFAPHLICPRNLPPEALHYLAKKMSSIIAYMIIRGQDIFSVPAKLATDIRAYFLERKRKKTMSPEMTLDESISDISTVNTVYTFVDREKTAAAHNTNTTDTELAQLYAHIQSMPESSKKRRLIKQFNKQNGQGTPLQLQAMNRAKNPETARSAKSLGDSIKKHIFHKGIISRTPKRQPVPAMILETPNNSGMKLHKQRILFQSPNTQTYATTNSSESCSTALSTSSDTNINTNINTANSHCSYNITPQHSLQKSISSTSLLMTQPYEKTLKRVSSSQLETSANVCWNTNMLHNNSSNSLSSSIDGFVGQTKSVSAPVSRQASSDLQNHINSSITSASASSSSSLSMGLNPHLDPNCCVTPLKLISDAAKRLTAGTHGGGGGEKKSVAWNDDHLVANEHIYTHPSTPLRNPNSSDLKSRYKSEPNLSISHDICEPQTSSSTQVDDNDSDMMITPTAKHVIGRALTRRLMKGVSMGNLKFPFSTPESTKRLVRTVSSTLKRRSSDDAQIYQQAEGSLVAAIKSGNAPLLQNMDDDVVDETDGEIDDEDFLDQETGGALENENDSADEHNDGELSKANSKILNLISANDNNSSSSSNSSSAEVTNCFAGGSAAYQQLLAQQSGLYHRSLELVTSTPSLLLGRRSMSPITKSTQRMPKAMQESIMTPRSRKPVMVLTTTVGSTDQNQTINHTDSSDFHEQPKENLNQVNNEHEHRNGNDDDAEADEEVADGHEENGETNSEVSLLKNSLPPKPEIINEDATSLGGYSDIFKRRQLFSMNQSFVHQPSRTALALSSDSDSQLSSTSTEDKDLTSKHESNITNTDALTENFKDYLLTRSVLTAPPEDTSFTSHSDDFNSSHEIEELEENQLSSSLLYCLDGNKPEPQNESSTTTADTYDETEDDTKDITHTNTDEDAGGALTLGQPPKAIASSSSNSNLKTNSSKTVMHVPLKTNRLANNPFVILNNARKRAANQDLEKISSTLFNSQTDSPVSTRTLYRTDLKSVASKAAASKRCSSSNYKPGGGMHENLPRNSNSSSNKENCEHQQIYTISKKLLMSEYPGETSF